MLKNCTNQTNNWTSTEKLLIIYFANPDDGITGIIIIFLLKLLHGNLNSCILIILKYIYIFDYLHAFLTNSVDIRYW